MTVIVTILTEGYADWETALLNAAAPLLFPHRYQVFHARRPVGYLLGWIEGNA